MPLLKKKSLIQEDKCPLYKQKNKQPSILEEQIQSVDKINSFKSSPSMIEIKMQPTLM